MNALSEKLQRSWHLFKSSVRVIVQQPKLLVFPIVTGLLTTAIALFFLAPVALVFLAPHWISGGTIQTFADKVGFARFSDGATFNFHLQPLGTTMLAGIYLLNMFLATLASVAFNAEIIEALSGHPVSIQRGIAVACRRWQSILLWSLVAGVVGLIIRWLEERWSLVGRAIAGLIGLAWSMAAIFAIPILARDNSVSNPFAILSKSATTIKRTWGEMLAGYVGLKGMNLMVLWASIVSWISVGIGAYLLSNPWVLLLFGLPWLATIILYSYLTSIASRVYLCALYFYASEGVVPAPYDESMMAMGWKLKKG
ncbi:MAG TPA: DUF6159 family protein [Candidatus Limnocylindrales bacterium]|nr:DUF6159 family protein [Candidatus Limnocylindrales bacterium]